MRTEEEEEEKKKEEEVSARLLGAFKGQYTQTVVLREDAPICPSRRTKCDGGEPHSQAQGAPSRRAAPFGASLQRRRDVGDQDPRARL